jgi:chromosome segregation ATPase
VPKTKDLVERIKDARAEHAQTEKKIGELTAELNSVPGRISAVDWGDEEKAISTVAELERHRDALPHYLKHLRKQAVEQELVMLHFEKEEVEGRRPEMAARVERLQEEFNAAQERLNKAKGAHHELVYGALSDARRAISDAEKRLWALNNEKGPEASGPIVRSTWQQTQQQPGVENFRATG